MVCVFNGAIAGLSLCVASSAVLAQAWPNRPIRTISPFSSGNATDVTARVVLETVARQSGSPS
jgi:tripartite-type tricarboxylate transporter receptor subunit TctC